MEADLRTVEAGLAGGVAAAFALACSSAILESIAPLIRFEILVVGVRNEKMVAYLKHGEHLLSVKDCDHGRNL